MQLFWFQRWSNFDFQKLSNKIESCGFDGILFPYLSYGEDCFISIAKNIDISAKIKYMVAIRPYTISPQYLFKIVKAINGISKDRILINFVSGWIYDEEKKLGGVHGEINDLSSNIDRSNYLIDYIKTVNKMDSDLLNFYVSVTNNIVFEKTKDNKYIIPYSWYKEKKFGLSESNTMISICPVIRKTREEIDNLKDYPLAQDVEFFTEEEFLEFLNIIESNGINGLLIFESSENIENENILRLIKQYKKIS
jgi:alkanesulfonate monooxygenase SsuD/methylene tetrahydromethanopterin reductase-like flavin-dependent oxidoreductase (luciferase family)